MHLKRLLFLLSSAACLPTLHAANIIDSIYGIGAGSFETPVPAFTTYATYQVGSTDISGWTVDTVNIDWVKDSIWNASDGHYSIDMNGTNQPNGTPSSPGGLHTVIPTTIGSTYRVTFDVAGFVSEGNSSNPKTMDVTADGVAHAFTLTTGNVYAGALTTPLDLDWETRSFEFTATTVSTMVSFLSTVSNGDGSAMLLDNVVIETVPEPSVLVLSGIAAVALLARRRRAGV